MAQQIMEGTPAQLARLLGTLPAEKRYQVIEVSEEALNAEPPLPDPKNAASIALLKSWIAEAPTDPETIKEAEEELLEFMRNMNKLRKETGARLHYPEVE